ncbi:hypothetical protein [Nocardioides marmoraquaticus]
MAQPPYQPPYPPPHQPPPPGHPSAYAARPAKPRPRRRWFVVGALLLLAAVVTFGVGLATTIGGATQTDAVVDATSGAVEVGVEVGAERMLYVPESLPPPACRLTDAEGRDLPLRSSALSTTVTADGRTWLGVGTFTSTTPEVSVDCQGSAEGIPVRIGAPLGGGFVAGLLLTILGPMVLGLAGLVVLVVTTVLWFSRPPRSA